MRSATSTKLENVIPIASASCWPNRKLLFSLATAFRRVRSEREGMPVRSAKSTRESLLWAARATTADLNDSELNTRDILGDG